MKEERIMILNMLQEGRITVDEATRLLDAVEGKEDKDCCRGQKHKEVFDERVNKISNSVEGMAKDFSNKIESAYKELEPKLKQASRKVVEKTAQVVDCVASSLNETLESLKVEPEEENNQESEDVMKDNDGNDIVENKDEENKN